MPTRVARRRRSHLSSALRFWVLKSLRLDARTLGLRRLPMRHRLRLVTSKAAAMPRLMRGQPAHIRVGNVRFSAGSVIDLGSLQSCIVDFHDQVVVPGVLADIAAPVIVDVGANTGQFAAAAKAYFPAALVTSFEPDPDVYSRLAANADGMDGVAPRCAAAGAENGVQPLFRAPLSLMSTLRPRAGVTAGNGAVDVDVVRLDDALTGIERIHLLKVDVEGSELEVLLGAHRTLRRTRYLLVEIQLGDPSAGRNLAVLEEVRRASRTASIVRFGRPLGPPDAPICQDVLIRVT